jgi:hypothetical protein
MREEKRMGGETKKTVTPVPWDNMPRQPEAAPPRPQPATPGKTPGAGADLGFALGHVFHPFPGFISGAEEEK